MSPPQVQWQALALFKGGLGSVGFYFREDGNDLILLPFDGLVILVDHHFHGFDLLLVLLRLVAFPRNNLLVGLEAVPVEGAIELVDHILTVFLPILHLAEPSLLYSISTLFLRVFI